MMHAPHISGAARVWRTISILTTATIGGAFIGCLWAGAASFGNDLAMIFGIVFGGLVGLVISPIAFFTMWRKELPTAAVWIYVPSIIAATLLGAAIRNELVSFFATVGFYTLAAITVRLKLPNGWPRVPNWCCIQCGYDLRGLPTSTCPECGLVQPPRSSDDENPAAHPKSMRLARYCAACNEDLNWITSPRCINCGAPRTTTDTEAEEFPTKPRPPAADAPDSIT